MIHDEQSFRESVKVNEEFLGGWGDKVDELINQWCRGGTNQHHAHVVTVLAKYMISLVHEAAKQQYPEYAKMSLAEFLKLFANHHAPLIARAERNTEIIEGLKGTKQERTL